MPKAQVDRGRTGQHMTDAEIARLGRSMREMSSVKIGSVADYIREQVAARMASDGWASNEYALGQINALGDLAHWLGVNPNVAPADEDVD